MRSTRTMKTLLGGVVASSALIVLLAAAPAASTAGTASQPVGGHDPVRAAAAPSRQSATPSQGARASLAAAMSLVVTGSPNSEAALIRDGRAVRHAEWLARVRASKLRAVTPRSNGSSSQTGSNPYPGGSVRDMVVSLFSRIAGSGQVSTALCVANRESHFDPSAKNRYSSAAGVFQWVASSWASYSRRYGFGGWSVFDAYANIAVAAHAVADGGWGPWGGGCW